MVGLGLIRCSMGWDLGLGFTLARSKKRSVVSDLCPGQPVGHPSQFGTGRIFNLPHKRCDTNHEHFAQYAISANHHPGRAGGLLFDFCGGRYWCHADFRLAGVGRRAGVGQEAGSGLPLCLLGGLGRVPSLGATVDPALGVQEGCSA